MKAPQPLSPTALAAAVADAARRGSAVAAAEGPGVRRGVQGPGPADAAELADAVASELADRAVPVARVRSEEFLRARSLRLERGPADPEAFFDDWYDLAALRREVLDPLGAGGSQEWLPGLRDPGSDRPLRRPRRSAPPGTVAVVDGMFLARWEVADAVDLLVHHDVTPAARARRLDPAEHARVLPAWERYLQWCDPAPAAAFVVRYDRPAHPALLTVPDVGRALRAAAGRRRR